MQLDDYLDKKGISAETFARTLRVSTSAVYKWRIKDRTPSSWMIAKIERATRGSVKLKDWHK